MVKSSCKNRYKISMKKNLISPLVVYRPLLILKLLLPYLALMIDCFSVWILYPPKIGNNTENSEYVIFSLSPKIFFKYAKQKYYHYYLVLRKPNEESHCTTG